MNWPIFRAAPRIFRRPSVSFAMLSSDTSSSFQGEEKPVRKPSAIEPPIKEVPNSAKLKKRDREEAGTERSMPLNKGRSDFRRDST